MSDGLKEWTCLYGYGHGQEKAIFTHTGTLAYEMPIKKLKVIKRATHNKARAVPVRLCVWWVGVGQHQHQIRMISKNQNQINISPRDICTYINILVFQCMCSINRFRKKSRERPSYKRILEAGEIRREIFTRIKSFFGKEIYIYL